MTELAFDKYRSMSDSLEAVSATMAHGDLDDFGEVYSAYAAGALDPAFALLVETQCALKPEVSRAVMRSEAIAVHAFEHEPSVALTDTAMDDIFAAIDALDLETEQPANQVNDAAVAAGTALDELCSLPQPVRDTALDSFAENGWKSLTPGIKRMRLNVDSRAEIDLYRIEPGARVPEHSHKGGEITLVLSGSFTDETGQFRAGDISVKSAEDVHQPVGDAGEVCYALAVYEGGLRFTGVMGFLQRLMGQ